MDLMLKSALESLNSKVVENLELVRENDKEIDLLAQLPESDSKSKLLRERYSINKKLLYRNIEHLDAQLRVAKAMENNRFLKVNIKQAQDVDLLQEIVKGEVSFNEMHPKFNDTKFINMLIEYHRHNDEFEECVKLKKHLKVLV